MTEQIERPEMLTTRRFWNANPCGARGSYEDLKAQRYAMEPWVPQELRAIAATRPRALLEVGCGQGVDSIELCSLLPAESSYVGIDYSENSGAAARANAAACRDKLAVTPSYQVGNAEALHFEDAQFDAVYSMGVLHHTHDERRAIAEVRRVLHPQGTAYIALYRKPSIKVGIAQGLRLLQRNADFVFRTDRSIYSLIKRFGTSSKLFGTMFHECFGVPYLKWYNRREIESLFSEFSQVSLKIYGANLGRFSRGGNRETPTGYFWYITASK